MEKQTNPNGKRKKRQIGAKKKKKNPNVKTNKPKRQNKKEIDRCLKINTEIYLLKKKKKKKTQTEKQKKDRSVLIGTIGAHGSRLVGARGYGS